MSVDYVYDFSSGGGLPDFTSLDPGVSYPNASTLSQEVTAAGLVGLEGVFVETNTSDQCIVTFAAAINVATLDAVIAAHTGLNASGQGLVVDSDQFQSVGTLTDARALSNYNDGDVLYVLELDQEFYMSYTSGSVDDGVNVIKPTTETGNARWLRRKHAGAHMPGAADALTTAAPGNIQVGDAAAEGLSASYARATHVHGVTRGTPVAVGTANSAGTSTQFVGADHVHAHGNQPLGTGTDHAAATAVVAGFMAPTDKSKLDGIAAGANAYSHPNHTGDVTSVGDGATVIANNAVSNPKLLDMAQSTIKGRAAASGTGDPQDLSPAQVRTIINVADGANAYVHPNHSGDVVSVGDGVQTIQPNSVSNTKLAKMAANTLKGNNTGSPADPADLSVAQVLSMIGATPFGDGYQQASSDFVSSTTSPTFRQKLRMTTASLPAGTYRIGYSAEVAENSTRCCWQIQINDSTTVADGRQNTSRGEYTSVSGFYYHTGSGVLNIDFDYSRKPGNSGTAYIRRARLEIWRVS